MKQVGPIPAKVEAPLCLSEVDKLIHSAPITIGHNLGKETIKADFSGAEDSAYPNTPYSPDSVNSVESRKRKCEDFVFHGAPLPYLIRPHMKLDICDGLDLYNDYAESLSDTDGSDYPMDDESDQGPGFIMPKNVEASPLPHLIRPRIKWDKFNSFNLNNEYAESLSDMGDESDEDFVLVENIESLASSEEVRGQTSPKRKLPDAGTVNQNDFGGHCSQGDSVNQLGSTISGEKERVHQTEPVDAESNEEDWEIV